MIIGLRGEGGKGVGKAKELEGRRSIFLGEGPGGFVNRDLHRDWLGSGVESHFYIQYIYILRGYILKGTCALDITNFLGEKLLSLERGEISRNHVYFL